MADFNDSSTKPYLEMTQSVNDAVTKFPIRHQLFIDGKFVDAQSGETLTSVNPHDNSAIAEVAMAGKADIDAAVAAAQAAFPKWSASSAGERGKILLRLADLVEANAAELTRLESLD